MSEGWDEYAGEWDSNKDVIAYSEKAVKSLLKAIDIEGLRILDFGCGTGLLSEKMSPLAREIVALDTSKEMISVLTRKRLPNVTTVSEDLSESLITGDLLFSENFDLIVASSVCSFLPDYAKTLALLKSLLIPNGIFIQWDWLATENDSDFGLSRQTIISTYDKVGLKLQFIDQIFCIENRHAEMPVIMGIAINP